MSEEAKTVTFLVGALVISIGAFVVSREAPEKTAEQEVGKAFVEIDNPLDVKQLKVVKFDAKTGQPEPFEVAQVEGLYSIPSHENYPADAQDHLVGAVNFVNNAKILASVADSPGSHKDFGVLDPTSESLGRGEEGVGTRVAMSDVDGKPLADFIIGKEVKDAEGQHYVRYSDKDQVYTVKIDPGKISTRFEDWIERDLLKLDTMDVSKVAINDYSVLTEQQPVLGPTGLRMANVVVDLDMKSSIDLAYDQKEYKWKLKQLVTFNKGQPEEQKLAENEELNTSKLSDLKNALDDLEIVDVRRKAEGLGSNLEQFVQKNPEALGDLESRGFYFQPLQGPGGQRQYVLLSNNGEVNIGLKTGVEYVLRFGEIAGAEKDDEADEKKQPAANGDSEKATDETTTNEKATDETTEEGKEGAEKDSGKDTDEDAEAGNEGDTDESSETEDGSETKDTKVLRYLFVITQFNQKLIEDPDLEEVPPEEPPAEEKVPDEKKPDEKKPEEDTKAADGDADDAKDNADADGEKPAEGDTPTDDAGSKDETAADGTDEAKNGDEPTTEADTDGNTATDEPADEKKEGSAEDKEEEDPAKKLEEWKEKRDEIIQKNEEKQKDYDKKIEEAKKRVEELNERFAAWYYVINDETYHKIHLSYNDIIKEKEKTEDEKKGENGDGTGGSSSEDDKDSLETFDDLKKGLPSDTDE